MKFQRVIAGQRYMYAAHSKNQATLEAQAAAWPGARIQWESIGVLIEVQGKHQPSGPCYVLWLPASLAGSCDQPSAAPANAVAVQPSHTIDPVEPEPAKPLGVPPAEQDQSSSEAVSCQQDVEAHAARTPIRYLPKTTKYKNITRMEAGAKNRAGYFVRVAWKKQKRSRFFADEACGDRLAALAAALAWRDETERELGKPRTELQVIGSAKSNTGFSGVTKTHRSNGSAIYQATWYEEGRQRRRIFSIARLGERQALRAAIAARQQGEKLRLR